MLNLKVINENLINMKINLTIPQLEIFSFLQKKGYEIKSWLWQYTDETFPGGVSFHEKYTFTATKEGESQSEKTLYLNVFEKEIKGFLKDIK